MKRKEQETQRRMIGREGKSDEDGKERKGERREEENNKEETTGEKTGMEGQRKAIRRRREE